jgi:hypothetical protein
MRASLLVRAGSAAAVAVMAMSGTMATAGAANAATAHARRLATHVYIAKRPAVLHRRHVTVLVGDLRSHRSPLRDKVLYLDRRTAGHKWVVVGKEETGKFGGARFVVDPKVKAHYALVFRGSPNFQGSHSRVVVVGAKG